MISKRQVHERRRDPRLDSNIPVKIRCEEGDIVTETVNISRSGAFCRINRQLDLMTKLKICLLLPIKKDTKVVTKKINCQGVIVRIEPATEKDSFNAAIFFNDISERDADNISDYVSNYLEQQNSV